MHNPWTWTIVWERPGVSRVWVEEEEGDREWGTSIMLQQ